MSRRRRSSSSRGWLSSCVDVFSWCVSNERGTNQRILQIAILCFSLFVLAETTGALVSNSLSLLGDAAAMSVGLGMLSEQAQLITGVVIPFLSVLLLLCVTVYILVNAVLVLASHPSKIDTNVDVRFLYGFAAGNLAVDALCFFFFYRSGSRVFIETSDSEANMTEDFDAWLGDSDEILGSSSNSHSGTTGLYVPPARLHIHRQLSDEEEQQQQQTTTPSKNLNMISAGFHVLGDTLRTVVMFLAALVSSISGIQGSVCDAWGAIAVSILVVIVAAGLVAEIVKRAMQFYHNAEALQSRYYSSLETHDEHEEKE